MKFRFSKQRIYAFLLILGASTLLFRTIRMVLIENAFNILVFWVFSLLIIEFLIDLSCVLSSIRWFISNNSLKARLPLRLGASAAIFHAIRVLIFVLGRTGPWINFDVKQEYRDSYTFKWFWVYFALILSILGILGVIVIWQIILDKKRKRTKKKRKSTIYTLDIHNKC